MLIPQRTFGKYADIYIPHSILRPNTHILHLPLKLGQPGTLTRAQEINRPNLAPTTCIHRERGTKAARRYSLFDLTTRLQRELL